MNNSKKRKEMNRDLLVNVALQQINQMKIDDPEMTAVILKVILENTNMHNYGNLTLKLNN